MENLASVVNLASMASVVPSKLLFHLLSSPQPAIITASSPSAGNTEKSRRDLLRLIRACLLLAFHALLFLIRLASLSVPRALYRTLLPDPNPSLHHDHAGRLPPPPMGGAAGPGEEGSTYVERALSHVLMVVTRIPVSSRKYELARGLTDRLLDENLLCGSPALAAINRAALTAAFSRTLRNLEVAALRPRGPGRKADRSVERILGGVYSRLRLWTDPSEEDEGESEYWTASGSGTAEKLAAETLWLAEKMAACGAAAEALERWGAATVLAELALTAEPRLQGTFVRISAFLFKHASSRQLGGKGRELDPTAMMLAQCHQMDMLTSWLPLLCRASNGMEAPVLSRLEREDTDCARGDY